MKNISDEARLREMLEAAKEFRREQLEADFASLQDCKDLTSSKDAIREQIQDVLTGRMKEMLKKYDEASNLLVGKAKNFFYNNGSKCVAFATHRFNKAGDMLTA